MTNETVISPLADDEPTSSEIQQMLDNHEARIQDIEFALVKAGLIEDGDYNLATHLTKGGRIVNRPRQHEEADESQPIQ